MNEKKNLTTEETFALAVENQKKNNFQIAENLYKEALKKNPNHFESIYYLGTLLAQTKRFDLAKLLLHKAIQIQPNHADAHYNLGVVLQDLGEYQKAKSSYEKVITIQPNYAKAHNNLGNVLKELGERQKAISSFEKAIEINPSYANAHNNLGIVFKKLGKLQKAISSFKKAIQLQPNQPDAHNNLGLVFEELGEVQKAKSCIEKAIEINPNYVGSYWNLHSFASDIDEALTILKKLYEIDNKHIKAKIMISAFEGFKGNFNEFDALIVSSESNHPYTRSIKWIFSLPKVPKIFFNRWNFYDAVIALAENSRPFYEFGVWNGISFQYLINNFKKGFGFDTFTGLPESWHDSQAKGAYSGFGSVPKIAGGEFIVGNFEDTLPKFFSKKRPLASLINFDADLYSSTLCALNYSNEVIDEKSILVFDELIMNKNWEKDEYKALNEFCDNLGISYDVLAVSFFTGQVAVKLKKN